MKNLSEVISESMTQRNLNKNNVTLKDLKEAFAHSSFMNDDRSWVKIDGTSYVKIKADEWQKQVAQAHAFQPIYTSEDMLYLIKKAKDVDLSNVNFKK